MNGNLMCRGERRLEVKRAVGVEGMELEPNDLLLSPISKDAHHEWNGNGN